MSHPTELYKQGLLPQYNCEIAGCKSTKSFNSKSLKRHKERVHGKRKFTCDIVGCKNKTGFVDAGKLDRHKKTHQDDRPHKCLLPDCRNERGFKTFDELDKHTKYVHNEERPYRCDIPGCNNTKGFRKSAELRIHIRTHSTDRPYKCEKSNCTNTTGFKSQTELTQHLEGVHGEQTFMCQTIGCKNKAGFSSLHALRQHQYTHTTSQAKYPCLESGCDKAYPRHASLERHLLVHTGEKPFQCSECLERFQRLDQLKRHQMNIHGIPKQTEYFQCDHPLCEKTRLFESIVRLKRHKKVVHGEKSFECKECDTAWSSIGLLRSHVHKTHSEKTECCDEPGCEKAFTSISSLNTHKKQAHGERLLKCNFPGCKNTKGFPTAPQLKQHTKIHGMEYSERKYCDIPNCGNTKGFKSEGDLWQHKRKMHKIQKRKRKDSISYGQEDVSWQAKRTRFHDTSPNFNSSISGSVTSQNKPWTERDNEHLIRAVGQKIDLTIISKQLNRSEENCGSQLLVLEKLYGGMPSLEEIDQCSEFR